MPELPLFPLNTVLFPGGLLPLRIFEPRYLDMVGRCMREGADFGVVLISERRGDWGGGGNGRGRHRRPRRRFQPAPRWPARSHVPRLAALSAAARIACSPTDFGSARSSG